MRFYRALAYLFVLYGLLCRTGRNDTITRFDQQVLISQRTARVHRLKGERRVLVGMAMAACVVWYNRRIYHIISRTKTAYRMYAPSFSLAQRPGRGMM